MAKYHGTFSCGHEGVVNVIGPSKDRQWKIDNKFSKPCEECYLKHLEEDRIKKNKEALEAAKEMELPNLTGSEKQIAWGNTLRQGLIEKINKKSEEFENENEIKLLVDYMINNKIDSKYYIDNRFDNLIDIMKILLKEYEESKTQVIDESESKEVIQEGTVSPKEVKFTGIVQISASKEKITATYEKNDTFRDVVKKLYFNWKETKWERNINELTGTYIDRAAELGNKLLNTGFTICIIDEEIRQKAINGEYEQECNRWIKFYKDSNKLAIRWYDKNDYMYSAAKRIKTSQWKSEIKSILVDISHYKEVEEFATFYECKFTQKASEFIEQYKIEVANIEVVEPVKIEAKQQEDGLKNILDSSREVIDDLRDDD